MSKAFFAHDADAAERLIDARKFIRESKDRNCPLDPIQATRKALRDLANPQNQARYKMCFHHIKQELESDQKQDLRTKSARAKKAMDNMQTSLQPSQPIIDQAQSAQFNITRRMRDDAERQARRLMSGIPEHDR